MATDAYRKHGPWLCTALYSRGGHTARIRNKGTRIQMGTFNAVTVTTQHNVSSCIHGTSQNVSQSVLVPWARPTGAGRKTVHEKGWGPSQATW